MVTKKKTKKSKKKVVKAADPIVPTNSTRRDEDAAFLFGPAIHDGTEGTVITVSTYDEKTGYPDEVVFRPRYDSNNLMSVKYDEVKALNNGFR